jgi:hypothetical protein
MLKVVADEAVREDLAASLDEIVREGARRMLAAALEDEVAAYLAAHAAGRGGERAAAGGPQRARPAQAGHHGRGRGGGDAGPGRGPAAVNTRALCRPAARSDPHQLAFLRRRSPPVGRASGSDDLCDSALVRLVAAIARPTWSSALTPTSGVVVLRPGNRSDCQMPRAWSSRRDTGQVPVTSLENVRSALREEKPAELLGLLATSTISFRTNARAEPRQLLPAADTAAPCLPLVRRHPPTGVAP